jgi:(1->4)-alpha-D-glucan 1-alpha-D-glucosylmutase
VEPQHLGPVEAQHVFSHRRAPDTPRATWPAYSAAGPWVRDHPVNAVLDHASMSLAEQARRLGVADRYHGFWGKEESVPEAVLQRAVARHGGDGREPRRSTWAAARARGARRRTRELRWTSHDDCRARWRCAARTAARNSPPASCSAATRQRPVALPDGLAPATTACASTARPRRTLPPHRRAAPVPRAAPLQQGERWWGCTIQLYALRSSRNWGIGDFGDLRRMCDAAAHQGRPSSA